MLSPRDFFDTEGELFNALFKEAEFVWEGIRNIQPCIRERINPNTGGVKKTGPLVTEDKVLDNGAVIYAGSYLMSDDIEIGEGAVVEPGAYIKGPAIIGAGTEVRNGAYIRGNVITGKNCVVGHTTEMKNSAMLGESKAGHFAYIGDSILGKVNLGAGTKLANLKVVKTQVIVRIEGRSYETGLKKFGAIMGDGCETGCNSVTAPGTLLSKDVIVYPNTSARGYYPPGTIIKLRQSIEKGERHQ